jgi:protein tyrosine phosphatase (PTP) superfamily phosphohydrolase (DUF442 family)
MTKTILRTIVPALVLAAFATPAFSQESESIRNFLRVNESFCTAGQPTTEELTALKNDGTVAVLNLRLPSEHDADEERAAVEALGMRYFNIPVDTNNLQVSQVEEFLSITDDDANRPMFIHCGSANRVGGFFMIRRVLRDGWSLEMATTEAEEIGLRNQALQEFALNYIEQNR